MKRLPTKAEFKALLKLTHKWDEERNGLIFTASNGNELFFPAMGYRFDIDVYSINYCGYYWSATPYSIFSAWYFYFDSDESNMNVYYVNYDQTIRLVSDEPCDNYIDMGIGIYWAQENYHEGKKIYFAWNEVMAIPDKVNEMAGLLMKKDGNTPELNITDIINWEQRRYEITKSILSGSFVALNTNDFDRDKVIACKAVRMADYVIELLK